MGMLLWVRGDNKSNLENLDVVFINKVLVNIKGDHPFCPCKWRETV